MVLDLDESKKLLLTFLESQMSRIAPNLSADCGSTIAARLLGIAGGLRALAAMPACNIQVFLENLWQTSLLLEHNEIHQVELTSSPVCIPFRYWGRKGRTWQDFQRLLSNHTRELLHRQS